MKSALFIFLSLFSCWTLADRDRGFYLGLGGRYIDSGVLSETGDSISFSGAEIYAGYKRNWLLGLEVRGGLGLKDTESFGTEFSIPQFYSIYYRAELSNDVAKLFVLGGYTDIEVEANILETNQVITGKDSGASFGAGIGFVIGESANLNFELIRLLSNDSNEFDSAGVTLDFRF